VSVSPNRLRRSLCPQAHDQKKGDAVIHPVSFSLGMNGDGPQDGYDLEYTRTIADAVKVPVFSVREVKEYLFQKGVQVSL